MFVVHGIEMRNDWQLKSRFVLYEMNKELIHPY